MRASFLILLGVAFAAGRASVPGELSRRGTPMAYVNDLPVTIEGFEAWILTNPPEVQRRLREGSQLERAKDLYVIQDALVQEATRRGLHERPSVQTKLLYAQREALGEALLEVVVEERSTEEALRRWYDEHRPQYARAQVHAGYIQVSTEQEANELLAQLRAGADFAELARTRSTEPKSAAGGGDMGWVNVRDLRGPLNAALSQASPGSPVGPVQLAEGHWAIAVLYDRRDSVPFEEAKEEIRTQLRQELLSSYIDELRRTSVRWAD